MAVIHISEAEAARDFAGLMAKVRAGAEVLIEDQSRTIAILRAPEVNPSHRKLSEVIRRSESRASALTLDPGFADDVEEGIRNHQHERLIDPWESF